MLLDVDARIKTDLTDVLLARLGGVGVLVEQELIIVTTQSKDAAPVDTGTLQNSGDYVMTGDAEGVAGFTAEYAPIVELRQPYLTPAYEASRERLPGKIKNLLEGG